MCRMIEWQYQKKQREKKAWGSIPRQILFWIGGMHIRFAERTKICGAGFSDLAWE